MTSVSDEEFENLVREGIRAIPGKFLRKLDNVAVVIEGEPTETQLAAHGIGDDETLFGLYEGIPQIKRWDYGGGVLPDKITIFRSPILREADTREEVRAIVWGTVWHEVARHFGMDEDEVAEREAKRQR